ncbi:MAG: 2-C-methyl-D-erythritol 4-phosphate cytidylyltransferase, partial [Pseudomonadota bacterium]
LVSTLGRLQSVPAVSEVVVVVAASEVEQQAVELGPVHVTAGGATRAASVVNGLNYIRDQLHHDGPVLVHDAARPCVRVEDINQLIAKVGNNEHGGILAIALHDTLKRADDEQCIADTVDRNCMWRAVTPQLFRADKLLHALKQAHAQGLEVTDEASAMELAGYRPRLVAGAQDNIKITVADDLLLARLIIKSQEQS